MLTGNEEDRHALTANWGIMIYWGTLTANWGIMIYWGTLTANWGMMIFWGTLTANWGNDDILKNTEDDAVLHWQLTREWGYVEEYWGWCCVALTANWGKIIYWRILRMMLHWQRKRRLVICSVIERLHFSQVIRQPHWPSGKASALRAEDPMFESCLLRDFSSDSNIGAWCYRVSTGTGRPCVSILWLGEVESLICNFYLSVAARKIEQIRPWDTLTCCWDIKQPTNNIISSQRPLEIECKR